MVNNDNLIINPVNGARVSARLIKPVPVRREEVNIFTGRVDTRLERQEESPLNSPTTPTRNEGIHRRFEVTTLASVSKNYEGFSEIGSPLYSQPQLMSLNSKKSALSRNANHVLVPNFKKTSPKSSTHPIK
jgi:hypothetical protein